MILKWNSFNNTKLQRHISDHIRARPDVSLRPVAWVTFMQISPIPAGPWPRGALYPANSR